MAVMENHLHIVKLLVEELGADITVNDEVNILYPCICMIYSNLCFCNS